MKLIFCPECQDIMRLWAHTTSECACEQSWGRYEDDNYNAIYGGKAIPLGIDNPSFISALAAQPESGMGRRFEAFVIPKECPTFKKEGQ